jgi:outer membrane protein W
MTLEKKMKKGVLFLSILALAFSFGFGQQKNFQVSLFCGLSHVLESGSEDEYVMGENDFPVTPVHTPLGFGADFAYSFTKNIAIALEARYILSSEVALIDPSDQDTVEVNTSSHIAATLNFIYHFLNSKISPYLVFGVGIDNLLAKDEIYTSEYGYEVEFLAPEKTIDPVIQAGGGILYFLSSTSGVKLDLRYSLVFDKPNNVSSLNLGVGFFLRF